MRATALVILVGLAGCVAGNPDTGDDTVAFNGGSITPPGCDYVVTTRLDAEAPALPPADATVGADPTVKQVHLGLAGDPRTSMVVTWRTVDDTTRTGTVRFGQGGAMGESAVGLTWGYKSGIGGVGAIVQMHEAHLCGLRPDTEYSYQIESDAAHTSPVYHFRTAPDLATQPDAEVVIASVGDSRDGYQIWGQLVQQLVSRSPDLILFSGDAVTVGQIQSEWEAFFTAGEPLFSQVPVISVHGNHDLNSINFYSQFAMPGDEENFSFDYGAAHITVLNDSPEQVGDLTGKIKAFLQSDLAGHQGAAWKLVNHHRPIYSASTRHGSDTTLRTEWAPILDQYHVDLVLSGHDHDYERTKPMRNLIAQATPADGTVYVVSGGAGAELYESGSDFWTQTSSSLHSATLLRIRRTMLDFTAFDEAGAAVDAFSIAKP